MAKEKAVSVKVPPAFGYLSPFTLDQPNLIVVSARDALYLCIGRVLAAR
jgi:hypothetical protein